MNWDNAGVVGADATSFRLTGLTPNSRVWVKVRASGPGGHSDYTNTVEFVTDSELPPAPANLRVANVWAREIDLNFNGVPRAVWYKLYRSVDGRNFVEVATVASGSVRFDVDGLRPGTRYFFRMLATNQFGNSEFSNTVEVTTKR